MWFSHCPRLGEGPVVFGKVDCRTSASSLASSMDIEGTTHLRTLSTYSNGPPSCRPVLEVGSEDRVLRTARSSPCPKWREGLDPWSDAILGQSSRVVQAQMISERMRAHHMRIDSGVPHDVLLGQASGKGSVYKMVKKPAESSLQKTVPYSALGRTL